MLAVIMITLTANSQSTVTQIKVYGVSEVTAYGRESYEESDGYIGVDSDNHIIYTYYNNGKMDKFNYKIQKSYIEDDYSNVETIAVNTSNGNRLIINIAVHLYENVVLITFADKNVAISFIGKVISN